MKRSFGYRQIAVTNTAQPAIGTTITANVPVSQLANQSIPVADSSVFDQGQWGVIDTVAGIAGPNGGGEEKFMVNKIVDPTHILIQIPGDGGGAGLGPTGFQLPHTSGCFIRPARAISNVYIQTLDGNVNPVFVTETPLGKTTGVRCIAKMQPVPAGQQPTDFKDSFTSDSGPNPATIAEYWVVGTVGDSYLPSFGVV